MWWTDIQRIEQRVASNVTRIHPSAIVEAGALLDDSAGAIVVGARTKICAGAIVRGPIQIGADSMIGNYAVLRGPIVLGAGVRIGCAAEIKNAQLKNRVSVGPMCFIADSMIEADVYLGAMVRTSNHRLDGQPIRVRDGNREIDTGCEKLGCWIGAGSALGIQVIVLPGRVIAPGSIFEPHMTISRNYPAGHYRVKQTIEVVSEVTNRRLAS